MHSYQYDEDNRLWLAKGTSPNSPLSYDQYMSYSPAGAIWEKYVQMSSIKNGFTISDSYQGAYEYSFSGNPYAVQYLCNKNHPYDCEGFCWDNAGNMAYRKSDGLRPNEAMCWTEDNRMQLYMRMGGDNSVAYYRYDDSGKRELKLLGRRSDVYNMGYQYKFVNFDDVVLYAGDLATFDRQGFKKHYFVEGRRFLTNVGSVGMPIMDDAILHELAYSEDIEWRSEMFENNLVDYLITRRNACSYETASIGIDIGWLEWMSEWCLEILTKEEKNLPYYLHTDRLGSGTVVTNEKGDAVHILTYMPHGETLLDLSQDFETPYQFTGYEKDPESGLYYAGARYQVPRLGSFNSTDPLWWKSPDKTSYHYCANNPIMFVDPDGRDTVPANEIWNYSTTNYRTDGTYGIHEESSYATVESEGVLYSLHEIKSGENEGNFLAIANYGKTEEGIDVFEYKYIVGKDKVQDFIGGQIEPVGLQQSLIEIAILLGTKYDNRKSVMQNYFCNWWECTSNIFNYLPEPSVKVKPGSWNMFLNNTKGMYNKRNFNGSYRNALKQRSIDYNKWKKTTKTVQVGR